MAGRGESNNLPFVSYQDGSGADEVLRPTLMTVSDGRSYRKITEATFGPERREKKAATRPAVYIEEDECGLDNHLKGMVIIIVLFLVHVYRALPD